MAEDGSPAAAAYWLSRLSGAPDGARLLPHSAASAPAARQVSAPVPQPIVAAARARARGSDRSLFALVATALAVALERQTGNPDVLFAVSPGVDVNGRLLPLRVRLDPRGSFKAAVLSVNAVIEEACRHVAGVSNACELLRIACNAGVPESCHVGLRMTRADEHLEQVGWLETVVTWRDSDASASLELAASGAAPDAARLAAFVEHVVMVLAAGVDRPDMRLDEMPAISRTDARRVNDFNATDVRWTGPSDPAHVRFARQARRTPDDAVAVVDGTATLTYRQLDDAAAGIAQTLRRHALAAESIVAVLPPRDARWVAALLGIWKAGCAYLPLDMVHTPARLATMIRASGAALVLAARGDLATVASILEKLPPAERPPVATIDSASETGAAPPRDPAIVAPVETSQLAYVIFTSGSTGVPKGAMVEHGGMRNHLEAKIRALALGPGDVVGVTASASFDVSIWQLLAALLAGGAVYVGDDTVVRDQLVQLRTVDRAGITILEVVPSQLRAMLELVHGTDAPSLATLRRLVVNGEPLGYDLCDQWRTVYPRVPLMNAYGPTECSDDVTHLVLDEWDGQGPVSIGRPLPNTRLYVLDGDLRPLPIGIDGEIYVGGDGVGRGYLADPVRTASAFVPDPFGATPGARLYRTGDRGRWTDHGYLYCLGRIDHQVKLRGFRIELGEVEVALRRHTDVRDAVVVVRDDMPSGPALVAYVVAREGRAVSVADLRAFVRKLLPEYMVPSAFVALSALPLTASGKVDRRALPAPTIVDTPRDTPRVPPRTPIEHVLSDIWAELLERSDFGIHDNFFELGGHSLVATRVVARVRDRLGVELPLQHIFSSPTIAGLSLVVGGLLVAQLEAGGESQGAPAASDTTQEVAVPNRA